MKLIYPNNMQTEETNWKFYLAVLVIGLPLAIGYCMYLNAGCDLTGAMTAAGKVCVEDL